MKCPDGYQIYNDPLNLQDKAVKCRYLRYGMPFYLIAVLILFYIASMEGAMLAFVISLIALIITYIVHEGCHFIAQWICSSIRPHIGFHWPLPFSALDNRATLSRKRAICAAIAPFGFITALCTIIVIIICAQNFLISGILTTSQIILIIIMIVFWNGAMCSTDFYLIRWILQSPSNAVLRENNLINILCIPINHIPPAKLSHPSYLNKNKGEHS